MYTLTRLVPRQELLPHHMSTAATALVIAELFYKFHSFTLKCVAFLGTWYAPDFGRGFAASILRRNRSR